MKHVKPALDYAIDTITIEEDFLENYKFELEYGNSQCSKDAKLIASDMYYGSLQKGNFRKFFKIDRFSKLTSLPLKTFFDDLNLNGTFSWLTRIDRNLDLILNIPENLLTHFENSSDEIDKKNHEYRRVPPSFRP